MVLKIILMITLVREKNLTNKERNNAFFLQNLNDSEIHIAINSNFLSVRINILCVCVLFFIFDETSRNFCCCYCWDDAYIHIPSTNLFFSLSGKIVAFHPTYATRTLSEKNVYSIYEQCSGIKISFEFMKAFKHTTAQKKNGRKGN